MSDIKTKIEADLERIKTSASNIGDHAANHVHEFFASTINALAGHLEKVEKGIAKDNKKNEPK